MFSRFSTALLVLLLMCGTVAAACTNTIPGSCVAQDDGVPKATPTLGSTGGNAGTLTMWGSTSGTALFQTSAVAGNVTETLPATSGTLLNDATLAAATVLPSGASTPVSLANALTRVYRLDDFGCVGNVISAGLAGAADDAACINNALTQVWANGGGTLCTNSVTNKAYKATSANITIPSRVTLSDCRLEHHISTWANDYTAVPGAIYLSTARTVNLSGAISGMYILASNITAISNYRQAATLVSGFAGTGVTCAHDDCVLRDVVIGGFNLCYDNGTGRQRPSLRDVTMDCTNGLSILNPLDTPSILTVRGSPFLTNTITQYSGAVTGIADNGAGVYRVTVTGHGMVTGDTVFIAGTTGAEGANGKFAGVTVFDANHFDLTGYPDVPSTTGATTSGLTYVTVASTTGLAPGQGITGTNVPGSTTITAVWPTSGAISISNAATGTGTGIALTISNSAYSTGGTAYLSPNQRSGTCFTFSISAVECLDCRALDYNIGYHFTSPVLGAALYGFVDNAIQLGDNTSIGVLVDGSQNGFAWNSGYSASVSRPLVVNVASTLGVTSVHGVGLGNTTGLIVEHVQGALSLDGISNLTANGLGFGPGITWVSVNNSQLPAAVPYYGFAFAPALVSYGPNNNAPNMATYTVVAGNNTGGAPALYLNNTSASANLRYASISVGASGNTNFAACSDAGVCTTYLQATRSGASTSAITGSAPFVDATVAGGVGAAGTLTLESTTGAGTTDAIIFKTASQAERMRILTSGGIGIGNTTDAGAGGVDINGQIYAPNMAGVGVVETGYVCWISGSTPAGKLVEDSVSCLSSRREWKKSEAKLANATEMLMKLQPKTFEWKDPKDANQRGQIVGMIAEDTEAADTRFASYDAGGILHGWRQDSIITTLVAGFQEHQKILTTQFAANQYLQSEISALQHRIEELENPSLTVQEDESSHAVEKRSVRANHKRKHKKVAPRGIPSKAGRSHSGEQGWAETIFGK